ncbi:hypothetical protein ACFWP5_24160 [Streptomyces sp. NPDC058469]|uniref:hypothetical protein n=1 Tax=Streptomyces sp. NPDC058469 TaxID=3346514 RepID=UPI0036634CF7
MSRRPLLFLDVDGPLNPYGRAAGTTPRGLHDDPDGVFVTARHSGPALLRHVDPRLGLREGDFAAPAEFAVAVRK